MRARWILAALALSGCVLGCAGRATVPAGSMLEAERTRSARLPDEIDRSARELMAVALIGTRVQAQVVRDELARRETARREEGLRPSGVLPYADHLIAAMTDDAIAYRAAALELLERDDLDEPLREFLQVQVDDDPLRLAQIRISDSRKHRSARVFNAFSSAAGRSMTNMTLAPVRMATAAVNVALAERMADPISLQERQALKHWKRYIEEHPGAPETPQIVARIESAQQRWFEMKRRRSLRAARKGLELGQDEVALLLSDRALRFSVEDGDAQTLFAEAEARLREKRAQRRRVLAAPTRLAPEQSGPEARALAVALLDPQADLLAVADSVLEGPTHTLYPEARFARAIALFEANREVESWEEMEFVARRRDGIARHASSLLEQPVAHPYGAFRSAIAEERADLVGQVMLGPMRKGPRELDLPRPLEWMIDGPAFVGTLGGIPQRLISTAFRPPPSRRPVVHAYRYLKRRPDGEHADEVREWLIEHESDRDNWVGAYQLARRDPDYGDDALEDLEERAAEQGLKSADGQRRRDLKLHYLNEVAMRYPDTEAGAEARERALEEIESAATQSIRISRGFLIENPDAAGPEGLGLRAGLLDDEPHNGELHPDGVTLVGGRDLEIALLAESVDDEDPPEIRHERLSSERLARLVALLDETAIENALIDPLAGFEPDADRDLFFERARLGIAGTRDSRAAASSSYAFVGVREKYSMVRTHKPLLPFDLVVQGTFPDLGLGAFPRLRPPATTPDAILYR